MASYESSFFLPFITQAQSVGHENKEGKYEDPLLAVRTEQMSG